MTAATSWQEWCAAKIKKGQPTQAVKTTPQINSGKGATKQQNWPYLCFLSLGGGCQRGSSPGMRLFWCKPCSNYITRWFTEFKAKWPSPMAWAESQFKFWHWDFTFWATAPGASFHLKTRQEYFLHDKESFGMLKTGFGGTWFSTLFGILCAVFLREMGQKGVSGQVLLRFAPFLLQLYSLLNVNDSFKNDTNQVSGGWDMREWWWQIGRVGQDHIYTAYIRYSWQ